jgi:hypothetical protein
MGIENDIKAGRFLGLDALQWMVRKRKDEKKNIRAIVKERQDALLYNDPKANIGSLVKGIGLIKKEYPDSARLLSTIVLLTQRFTRSHEQALEIIALEVKKPIQFIRDRELEAVRRVMDALESSRILQLA